MPTISKYQNSSKAASYTSKEHPKPGGYLHIQPAGYPLLNGPEGEPSAVAEMSKGRTSLGMTFLFGTPSFACNQLWLPSGELTWQLNMAIYSGFSHEKW